MTAGLILICDPSPQAQRALQVILRTADYAAHTVTSGEEALLWTQQGRPQAVILEVALPGMSGIELCRELRQRDQMPILVVSSIDAEVTKIEALRAGADDYITKPFSPGELLARLAARLRAAPSELRFEAHGLVIDLAGQQVSRAGAPIHLTATEFALLRVLVTSRGTVTHSSLATKVWGSTHGDVRARTRTHIQNLRAKLDPADGTRVIRSQAGIGYSFVPDTTTDRQRDRESGGADLY
jgi:two-component system, OmpR family, KDP operon response regulator KdpE